jgi:OmpA-OmpF porin, OOP family
MKRLATGFLAALLTVQLGCGALQEPSWNKPVGKGTWIPAAICTLVGAGAGVGIQEARRGCNTINVPGGATFEDCDDGDYWQGALIGAAIGAVVCGVAGHVFLDPTPVPEIPPPPPTPEPLPTPEPEIPQVSRRIVLRGITFDFDSSEIRADSAPVLDEAVHQLASNSDVVLTVVGHTDAVGTDDYNQRLSVARAEAVFRYLVNRGIAPERLTVVGMGESDPVATNESADGRARNRRVELKVAE